MDVPNGSQHALEGEPGPKMKSMVVSDGTQRRRSVAISQAPTKGKSVPVPEAATKRKSNPVSEAATKKKSVPASEPTTVKKSGAMSEAVSGKSQAKTDNDVNERGDKGTPQVTQEAEKGSEKGTNDNDKSSRRGTMETQQRRPSRIPVPVAPKRRTLEKDNIGSKHSIFTSSKGDAELGQRETSELAESEEGDEWDEWDEGDEGDDEEQRDESVKTAEDEVRGNEKKSQEIKAQALRAAMLQDAWAKISLQIQNSFDSPSRVYKLRKYHSEPDLALPFEIKFDREINLGGGGDDTTKEKSLTRKMEKFLSLEDITDLSGKEHPDLVFMESSDANLKVSAVTDKLKCTWMELVEMEKGRYSFFDELFAMGYVTDSLEVPSPPPKEEEGKSPGEYFVEAEERHYRKKVDYGRAVFKTKHVYTGNFEDWFFEGPGRYCWEDGTVYQGEFSRGAMHGPGSIQWPDGSIYEGTFTNGVRTGWGAYSTDDGQTYAGEWSNGLPHGHGKTWYDPYDADNNYYEGQWEQGLQEGVGTRQYATGDRYIGNWSQGLRSGYGIMIWLRERQVYKGEWFLGVPNGSGKHIWYLKRNKSNSFPTRHVYQGTWAMGMREGIGKMIYSCGSVYEGRWKNGQRHGKGIFINPAGGIVVGLFRAGAIIGGSDIALHVPTYECDFASLTEWLMAKFSLVFENNKNDPQNLHKLTKQYLLYIRKLYHRAGEYSQKYGNHGLYPSYLKKFNAKKRQAAGPGKHHALHRDYSRSEEPPHMNGRSEKPDSLDGVNPVTRFGLWLLVKDCEGLLDEVTMAYYDQIWSETPPISFQTKHNPFEPVYLWQFVQSLIVVALAYYVDIPRRRLSESRESLKDKEVHSPVVLKTSKNSDGAVESKSKAHKRKHKGRKNSSHDDVHPSANVKKTHVGRKVIATKAKTKKRTSSDKSFSKMTHKEKFRTMAEELMKSKENIQSRDDEEASHEGEEETHTSMTEIGAPAENEPTRKLTAEHEIPGKKLSKEHDADDEEEVTEQPTSVPELETHEEEEDSSYFDIAEEPSEKHKSGSLESRKKDRISQEVKSEVGKRPTENMVPTATSVAEYFELFLTSKLLPCLTRDPGVNLPVVPHPLPALVDMYDAFKAIKNRDVLNGSEMIKSALHLPDEEAWWQNSSNSPIINIESPETVEEEAVEQEDEGEVVEKEPTEKLPDDGNEEEEEQQPLDDYLISLGPAEDIYVNEKPDEVDSESYEMELPGADDNIVITEDKIDKAESEELKVESPIAESNAEVKTEKDASEYLGVQIDESVTIMNLLHLGRTDSVGEASGTGADNKAAGDDEDSSCEEDPPNHRHRNKVLKMGRSVADARAAMLTDFFKLTDSEGSLTEFIAEGHPFAEDELAPEPFLWADDYKCIPATNKNQHVMNIDVEDFFGALHGLYPNLRIGQKELNFDFIFCDWLWCMSLLAKTSTEREFQDIWQVKGVQRELTNPQSYGVYSHYVKLIKNNPYLSPTPPPDFRPNVRREKKKTNSKALSTK